MSRVHITQILEATAGGVRRHLYDLITHLDPARFEVSLIASAGREPGFRKDLEAFAARGVRIAQVPMARAIRPWADRQALREIRRLLREWRPDVVHTHSSKAGFLGRLAARQAGVKGIVHTPHCFAFEMQVCGLRKSLYARLERHAAPWCDRIVCVCEAERQAALARGIADSAKLVTIPNGVAPASPMAPVTRAALGLREGDVAVGIVGRLTRQKDPLGFLAAAALIARELPQSRFVFLGDGELRPSLERRIAELGLRTHCLLLGQREDARDCYAGFDAVAIPSRWEALPYALLDAMAAGRAVVATSVGGMPDALGDGECGVVVPAGDPHAMAAWLGDLLRDPARRRHLGERAQAAAARRFRLDTMAESLSTVYKECAEGMPPGGACVLKLRAAEVSSI